MPGVEKEGEKRLITGIISFISCIHLNARSAPDSLTYAFLTHFKGLGPKHIQWPSDLTVIVRLLKVMHSIILHALIELQSYILRSL